MKSRRPPSVRVSWQRTHVLPESKAFQGSIGLHEPVTHGSTNTEVIVPRSVDSGETLTFHLMCNPVSMDPVLLLKPRNAVFNVQDGDTDYWRCSSCSQAVDRLWRRRSDVKRGSSKGNDLQVPSQ